jgi:hypothetical protein
MLEKAALATGIGLSLALNASCGSGPPAESTPVVNLDQLPDHLPSPVSRQIAAGVAIATLLPAKLGGPAYSSGVRIFPDLYLIAGHAVQTDQNRPLAALRSCGRILIDGQGATPAHLSADPLTGAERAVGGSRISARKAIGSFIVGDQTAIPDIGLLQAAPTKAVGRFTPVTINTQPVRVGETMFFAVDQPGINRPFDDLALRDPYGPSHPIVEMRGNDQQPAKFAGVVGKILAYGRVVVFTGTRHYGPHPDSNGHEGSSGGGAWLANGQLAGIVAGGPVIDDKYAVWGIDGFNTAAVDKQFGVDIRATDVPAGVSYLIVQLVSPQLLRQEKQNLSVAPACLPHAA